MKLKPDCIPCFFKQASIVANILKVDDEKRLELFKGISNILAQSISPNVTPAFLASQVHKYIREFLQNDDPFKELKKLSNDRMLAFYNDFIDIIRSSDDHLKMVVTLSTLGNLIDYSLYTHVQLEEIKNKISFFKPAIFDYEDLRRDLTKAVRVLFITDNAGEIVLDKPLIELMFKKRKKIIVAAKEKPILNDATVDDLKYIGIDKYAKLIGIGNGDVGTSYPTGNKIFDKAIETADIIISKGQANFETLYDLKRDIYFFFVVKCSAVASFLQVEENSPVIMLKRSK